MFRFPYRADETDIWFEQAIERSGAAEPGGRPVRTNVQMINCRRGSENLIPYLANNQVLYDDEVVYYHSTASVSAVNILQCGIDLSKSRAKQDFSDGNGFYVTNNINKAKEWAKTRAQGGIGAIIAFKISKNLEKEEPHLSLEVQTKEGRDLWTKTVDYFRRGRYDAKVKMSEHSYKFITGPVSRMYTIPYDFDQTCIRDPDYAKRYGSLHNILFVIFIG